MILHFGATNAGIVAIAGKLWNIGLQGFAVVARDEEGVMLRPPMVQMGKDGCGRKVQYPTTLGGEVITKRCIVCNDEFACRARESKD